MRGGHPWLFAEAISQQSGEGAPGQLAVVFDRQRRFLAVGLYDPASPLRVRILHHGSPTTIDGSWLRERLRLAAVRRAPLPETGTTGYRLVHGENDGLPGLVIDRYGPSAAIKLYSAAWVPYLHDLRAALGEEDLGDGGGGFERIVLRLSRDLLRRPEYLHGLQDGAVLAGEAAGAVIFRENGLFFEADVARGQKTGFFLDQRENRALVETLAAGRRVLNVFAYTGGFSLYAARGGAQEVVSLDLSAPALAAAGRNFALNDADPRISSVRHEILVADAFSALATLQQSGRRFELVIVDPPSFAHRATEVEAALGAYDRLAHAALGVLAPGGILVMASCSSRVPAGTFFDVIAARR